MAVPKLRFKDDNREDYPALKDMSIGEICTIFKGTPLSKEDISNNGNPFLLYGELYTTYSEIAYDIVRKTDKIVDKKYYSHIGDVVIPTSGETSEEISTATCVMREGVILAGDLNIIRSDIIDGRILSYMCNHQKKHDIARTAQGASIVHSKADDLKKVIVSVPCKKEQHKIASFLSTFDKRIEAQQNIISDMEMQKKGLLQKIFSQEIRFKDDNGKDYPAWEKKKLGEIFKQVSKYTDINEYIELWSLTVENGLTPKTERYQRDYLTKKEDGYKIVSPNEFVYNPMNMTLGAIGYNNMDKPVAVSGYYT